MDAGRAHEGMAIAAVNILDLMLEKLKEAVRYAINQPLDTYL